MEGKVKKFGDYCATHWIGHTETKGKDKFA